MNLDSLSNVLTEVTDAETVETLIEPVVESSHGNAPSITALADVIADLQDADRIERTLLLIPAPTHKSDNSIKSEASLSNYYKRYLKRRRNRSPSTIAQYKRTIPDFLDFAANQNAVRISDLSTDLIDAYVDNLFDTYEADATIITYTKNVRAWLKWLSKRDLCTDSLYKLLNKDDLDLSPAARDEALPNPEAKHIITQLRRKRYGTAQHALIELLYNAGPRIGELHALDVTDFRPAENDILLRHRPETGTRLKNGSQNAGTPGDGERDIILKSTVIDALQQYIDTERVAVTDDYDREPLFSTARGRAARSTLRRWVYAATSCRWADTETDDVTCDGSCDPDSNVCPYSYYPHAIRRGAIVNHLNGDLRYGKASQRFDVSIPVIQHHYDPRTKQTRKQQRAEAVMNAWSTF